MAGQSTSIHSFKCPQRDCGHNNFQQNYDQMMSYFGGIIFKFSNWKISDRFLATYREMYNRSLNSFGKRHNLRHCMQFVITLSNSCIAKQNFTLICILLTVVQYLDSRSSCHNFVCSFSTYMFLPAGRDHFMRQE